MFSLIEAMNYKCLHYVRQPLGAFHVLVGPNASGKTTFLDVIAFLRDVVSDGLDAAIERRTTSLRDLVWGRQGDRFQLAVEARIPPDRRAKLRNQDCDLFRYELEIGVDSDTGANSILAETGLLKTADSQNDEVLELFPHSRACPKTILTSRNARSVHSVFTKRPGQHDNYYSESYEASGKGWVPAFKLGPRRSTLANMPEDESRFPVATWFKELLNSGVQQITLNSQAMRLPSPPGQGAAFRPDGANLPWVIDALRRRDSESMREWVSHLQTALPDIVDVKTIERPEDKKRYAVLTYRDNLDVPSWMASDGTLRLLALTLPAYLTDFAGVYLIEEPENGIHPRAVESMFESLSSVYGAQMLLATHSPVILSVVDLDKVLCFGKTSDGATDIVGGTRHPALRDWQREENLGVLFASGVLG